MSTAHAGSVKLGHRRIVTLLRKKYRMDYHEAMIQACEVFPLVVFIHMGEDNIRRIMNISECYVDDECIHYNCLWEFDVQENNMVEGAMKIVGQHKQVNNPSEYMIAKMKLYGITEDGIKAL